MSGFSSDHIQRGRAENPSIVSGPAQLNELLYAMEQICPTMCDREIMLVVVCLPVHKFLIQTISTRSAANLSEQIRSHNWAATINSSPRRGSGSNYSKGARYSEPDVIMDHGGGDSTKIGPFEVGSRCSCRSNYFFTLSPIRPDWIIAEFTSHTGRASAQYIVYAYTSSSYRYRLACGTIASLLVLYPGQIKYLDFDYGR